MSKYLKELKALHIADFKAKKPGFPEHAIPAPKYSIKNTNELTKAIKAYVNFKGGRLYRVNVQGQYDQKLGRYRQSGSDKGIPDLIGVDPSGGFLGVEIKWGSDRLSKDQERVKFQVEKSGGIYMVAKDMDTFCEWFNFRFFSHDE